MSTPLRKHLADHLPVQSDNKEHIRRALRVMKRAMYSFKTALNVNKSAKAQSRPLVSPIRSKGAYQESPMRDQKNHVVHKKSHVVHQKSHVFHQKRHVLHQKSHVLHQKSHILYQKSHVLHQNSLQCQRLSESAEPTTCQPNSIKTAIKRTQYLSKTAINSNRIAFNVNTSQNPHSRPLTSPIRSKEPSKEHNI